MTDETYPPTDASPGNETTRWKTRVLVRLIPALAALTLFIGTAAAQSPTQSFCNTDMAQTIQNIFTLF